MEFDTIELKPLSLKILNFMYNKDPIKAEEIAA